MFDVIIVGGGPAGLTAALWLGRCRRRVLLLDQGRPRNARSRRVSGFPTRDGTLPHELRGLGAAELDRYASVERRDGSVTQAKRRDDGFEIALAGGERLPTRKLLIATGLGDDCPDFPDARRFYGRGVYPCPYCDGYEHGDEPLAAFGRGAAGRGAALELTVWSSDLVLVTHGPSELDEAMRRDLSRHGIEVIETPITGLDGDPDGAGLSGIRLADGRTLDRRGIFFPFEGCAQSELVTQLGCDLSRKGAVETGAMEQTNVPGLFVAGDASRSLHFAVVAAAEGAMAAYAINTELLREDLRAARHDGEGR